VKIVVAGGTGFLGRRLSRALMDDGHEVAVMGRDPRKVASIPELAGATGVFGDVTDPYSLKGTLDGYEAIVVAIQFPNYPMEQPRKNLTFDRYDREGTEHLLEEAQRANVERFVYVSGVNVHPDSPQPWYRAKGRAERSIQGSGIRHAILRPSWAYGPGDKALNKFVSIAKLSPVVPIPTRFDGTSPMTQRIQPVASDDIALAISRIFAREDAWGRVIEIGGPEAMTMTEVVRTMLGVMRKKRLLIPMPTALMKLATAPLTLLPKPPLTPGAVDFAVQDGLADLTELRSVLEIEPIPLREGLTRYLSP
jgi:NADH dehydrogenase